MQTLERGEDWAWCFVDRLTLDLDDDGHWRTIDPFFDAGLEFAREAIAGGQAVPFPAAIDRLSLTPDPPPSWASDFCLRAR